MTTLIKHLSLLLVLVFTPLSLANEPLTLLSRANGATDDFLNSDRAFTRLLSRSFATKLQWTNQARLIKRLATNEAVCSYNIIKTAEREKHILFSDVPTSVYEQRKLFALKQTFKDLPCGCLLDSLLKKDFTLGVDSGTSYQTLEPIFSKYKDQIAAISSEDTSSQLPNLITHNRIDMIVDYEINVREALTSEQFKQLESREIAEYPAFINGFFACSKSTVGDKAIQAINRLMKTPSLYSYFQKNLKQTYSETNCSEMLLAYKKEFNTTP
ncbi:hypothetical protein ACOBV9_20695 (plasmid) [Pseudoalteromonas espejiana]